MMPAAAPAWSPAHRFGFRFICVYWFLCLFPFPAGWLPYTDWLAERYAKIYERPVVWFGHHALGITREIATTGNGSGDRTYDWCNFALQLSLALAVAVAWSLTSRRHEHVRLRDWLRTYVRYGLASAMLTYGLIKVWRAQFPEIEGMRLIEPIGDASPMGLLWTFMGFSRAYAAFAGLAEVTGGLLLWSRRTTTLGALVVIAAMSNVVMLNFCFDVPVKLYSSHLLLMAVYLAAPDLGRLANLLVLHRPTAPRPLRFSPAPRWHLPLKLLVLGGYLIMMLVAHIQADRKWGSSAPKPLLFGVYEVERFNHPGDAWSHVSFDSSGRVHVRTASEKMWRFPTETDEKTQTLTLTRQDDNVKFTLKWSRPDAEHLDLTGELDGSPLDVALKKRGTGAAPLLSRGFRWINEFPFNR